MALLKTGRPIIIRHKWRPRRPSHGKHFSNRRKDILVAAPLILLYLSLALWSLPSTGVTWDENRYIAQAKARAYSLYSMATGTEDLFFCDITNDFITGDYDAVWGSRCWDGRPKLPLTLSGITWAGVWYLNGGSLDLIPSIMAHRLAILLLTAAGLLFVYIFINRAYSRRAAIFSVLSIIFMPRFFGQSMYVLMDLSVSIFWIITLWFFWRGIKDWRYGALAGVMMGLTLTTKAQSIFIPFVILLWLVVSYRDRLKKTFSDTMHGRFHNVSAGILSLIFITPVVWVLAWPWLWYDSFKRFYWWMGYYLNHISGGLPTVYFMGSVIGSPSWAYIFTLAASTMPVPILALSIFGAYHALKDTISLDNRVSFLILLSALTPMVVLSIVNVAYNGVQQFIQSFLFLGILAGIGADRALRSRRLPKVLKDNMTALTAFVAMLIIVPGAFAIMSGHTDAYFNSIVGGTGGVYGSGLYEVEWSGEAYLDAAYWLQENAANGSSIYVPMANNIFNTYEYGDIGQIADRMDVSGGGLGEFNFEQATILSPDKRIIGYDGVNSTEDFENIDYIVLMSRFGLIDSRVYFNEVSRRCMEVGDPAYSVMYYGAPLVRVYRLPCS